MLNVCKIWVKLSRI